MVRVGLNQAQQRLVDAWFPGCEVVEDLSWGLVDTTVLHLRASGRDVVVKAAGPGNHHIGREIVAHRQWTWPWLTDRRVGRLLHADRERNVIALDYLPGVLVGGTPSAADPEIHRQAGELLAGFHGQASAVSEDYEQQMDARALRRLDGEHRIPPAVVAQLRAALAEHDRGPCTLVPTHGDWQPRNWLTDDGVLRIIDLGRADRRPAMSDLARLARQEWEGRADLEEAFLAGYGADPREPGAWRRTLLREAIGTATWAYQVGDQPFEEQGHRMIHQALEMPTGN